MRRQRGQVLPLALMMLVALMGLASLLLNTGRLLVKRERARVAADLTAYSGGVDYARGLNLLGSLNKIQAIVDIVVTYYTAGEGLYDCNALFVKFSDPVAGTGSYEKSYAGNSYNMGLMPVMAVASTIAMGSANGVVAIPFWNQEKLTQVQKAGPSFNLTRTHVSGLLSTVGRAIADIGTDFKDLLGEDLMGSLGALIPIFDSGKDDNAYSYKKRKGGQKVNVDSRFVKKVRITDKKSGRSREQYVYTDPSSDRKKFVKKDDGDELPFTLAETGRHSVTVWALKAADSGSKSRFFPDLPQVLAAAKVEVGGADLDVFNLSHFADFGVYFVPLDEKGLMADTELPDLELPRTGWNIVDEKIDQVESGYRSAQAMARAWLPELQH